MTITFEYFSFCNIICFFGDNIRYHAKIHTQNDAFDDRYNMPSGHNKHV